MTRSSEPGTTMSTGLRRLVPATGGASLGGGDERSPPAAAFLFYTNSSLLRHSRSFFCDRTGSIGAAVSSVFSVHLACVQPRSSRSFLPFIKRFFVRPSRNIYLIFGELSKYLYYLTSRRRPLTPCRISRDC